MFIWYYLFDIVPTGESKDISSIQFGGIETFCPLGHILVWGY